jgi:hypothetical protein
MAAEGLTNAIALGQERIKKVTKLQGQFTYPLFKYVMAKDKKPLNEFGRRIILYLSEDGGETFFTYSAPSFRDYVPPEYDAMRVYPARFAKAVVLNGDMLRALRRGDDNYFLRYQEKMDNAAVAARKILSRHFHGDGTGTLSIATSAHAVLGAITLTGMFTSGGTSAQASTKGTAWLKKNETYDAIDPAAETVRGTFTVTLEGRRQVGATLLSGTIAINDKIVQTGSYKKVPVGLRHLANSASRVLQNYNTANALQLNTPVYAAGGAAISPSAFAVAKGLVETFTNDETEAEGKLIIMTPGHQITLTSQGFQYRQYIDPKGKETISGFSGWKYVDQEGDMHFIDADAPDEQIRILDKASYSVGEDMPWGLYDDDGNEWRMRPGTNNSGSDVYFTAIGWHGQLEKAGVALCDALIDNVAHSGTDYATQSYA